MENNYPLNVTEWICDENALKKSPDIFIQIQPMGTTESGILQVNWVCKSIYGGKVALSYKSQNNFKVLDPRNFTIRNFGQSLHLSYEKMKSELIVRTSHLGNFNLHFSLPDSQVEEYYEKLGYGR